MKKEIKKIFNKNNYLLGKNKEGYKVWLEESAFDCDWYWGIGYVEIYNKHYTDIELHTHFDSLFLEENIFDSFKEYFTETPLNDEEIWQILELMQTLYTLRRASDMLHCGGSHITSVKKEKEALKTLDGIYEKINNDIIPDLLNEVYLILTPTNGKDATEIKKEYKDKE